ncbi:MAG TPA: metal ABC transporter substrate-binding protein [Bacillota bacterium]|nr:metal ABC transporter substrate-binding protein [Bacillota bacterium]
MKKIILCLLALILLVTPLIASCDADKQDDGRLSIVCTIFPEYDWIVQILADHADEVNLTMLLDNGVDLHSYQPSAADILTISTCDVFVYIGGESDSWVKDALEGVTNKDMLVVDIMTVLSDALKEEEIIEGMEGEEEEEEEESPEYDEHVWLSLKNAAVVCEKLGQTLGKADPDNAADYAANAAAYIALIDALGTRYEEAICAAGKDTLVFCDRFPFRYLVEDYSLNYYAAFIGCSAETEASFETIAFLANKIDELSLKYVLTIDNSNVNIASTIIASTKSKDAEILVLDSLQSITAQDIEDGTSYLEIMEENLEVIKKALS